MVRDISLLLIIGLALIMVLTLDFHEKENFYIEDEVIKDPNLYYKDYTPNPSDLIISRSDYANKLYGFWLGQCIANWTGLVTEMDKIGNIGEIKTGEFYTREDWGKPDQPNIWSNGDLSSTIDFVFVDEGGAWGSDDDTDIEYMYQHLHYVNQSSILTG
ncbi:MAG: ADP-ribosylglycohydrolase family protein, partial [Candidatus Marinimicrobia bacterium]|nr:ADP-ribosylglycohydrolase family protein [Candidatus Neomarinimicrobiota bacterium]